MGIAKLRDWCYRVVRSECPSNHDLEEGMVFRRQRTEAVSSVDDSSELVRKGGADDPRCNLGRLVTIKAREGEG